MRKRNSSKNKLKISDFSFINSETYTVLLCNIKGTSEGIKKKCITLFRVRVCKLLHLAVTRDAHLLSSILTKAPVPRLSL